MQLPKGSLVSTSHTRRPRAARISLALAGGLIAFALVLAGCGGGSSAGTSAGASTGAYGATAGSGAAPSSSTSSSSGSGGAAGSSVSLASSKLCKILVDANGRTLYLFEADKGAMSTCNGACASVWPPLTAKGQPKAGSGVAASKLGTTKRSDGTSEVTYNGHPLYTYAGDAAAGQTTGQAINGFGAEWYVLSAAGSAIETG